MVCGHNATWIRIQRRGDAAGGRGSMKKWEKAILDGVMNEERVCCTPCPPPPPYPCFHYGNKQRHYKMKNASVGVCGGGGRGKQNSPDGDWRGKQSWFDLVSASPPNLGPLPIPSPPNDGEKGRYIGGQVWVLPITTSALFPLKNWTWSFQLSCHPDATIKPAPRATFLIFFFFFQHTAIRRRLFFYKK